MTEIQKTVALPSTTNEAFVYQLCLEGHLSKHLSNYFLNFEITLHTTGHTVLTGPITDQAELFGLLKKVRDLGIPLISLNRLESNHSAEKLEEEL